MIVFVLTSIYLTQHINFALITVPTTGRVFKNILLFFFYLISK